MSGSTHVVQYMIWNRSCLTSGTDIIQRSATCGAVFMYSACSSMSTATHLLHTGSGPLYTQSLHKALGHWNRLLCTVSAQPATSAGHMYSSWYHLPQHTQLIHHTYLVQHPHQVQHPQKVQHQHLVHHPQAKAFVTWFVNAHPKAENIHST